MRYLRTYFTIEGLRDFERLAKGTVENRTLKLSWLLVILILARVRRKRRTLKNNQDSSGVSKKRKQDIAS